MERASAADEGDVASGSGVFGTFGFCSAMRPAMPPFAMAETASGMVFACPRISCSSQVRKWVGTFFAEGSRMDAMRRLFPDGAVASVSACGSMPEEGEDLPVFRKRMAFPSPASAQAQSRPGIRPEGAEAERHVLAGEVDGLVAGEEGRRGRRCP